MSSNWSSLTACVIFAVYGMAHKYLEEESFSVGALTVVGLATATPHWSDCFLWCWSCTYCSLFIGDLFYLNVLVVVLLFFQWFILFYFNLVVILSFLTYIFILKKVTRRLFYLRSIKLTFYCILCWYKEKLRNAHLSFFTVAVNLWDKIKLNISSCQN